MEQAVRLYEESLQQGEDETSGKPFNIEILFTEIPSRTVEFLETAEKDEQFFKGVQPIKQTNGSVLKEGEQGWMELQTPKMESEEIENIFWGKIDTLLSNNQKLQVFRLLQKYKTIFLEKKALHNCWSTKLKTQKLFFPNQGGILWQSRNKQ